MANTFRVTVSGRLLGQVMQNVFYVDGGEGAWTHTSVKDYVLTWFVNQLKAVQVNTFNWETIEVRDFGPGPDTISTFTLGQIPGTMNTSGILTVGAFIIQKRTGIVGRENRGRIYMPGPSATHTSNNLINATGIAAFAPILTTFRTQWAAPGTSTKLQMMIVGKGPTPHTVHVTDFLLAPGIGIQRRRNINVGI